MVYNPTFYLLNSPTAFANGYTFRRSITLDHTKCGASNSTNFPVLISGTYTYLKTVANSGNVTNANGYDIIFTSDLAGNTTLSFEIESYSASTGVVNFWVKVPTVSSSVDTVIYLFYGNSLITTSQENITGTWNTNVKAVYHMNDNAANTTVKDSTGVNNGTNAANTSTKTATGQISKGLTYNGSTDVTTGVNITAVNNASAVTFSAWINTTAQSAFGGVISKVTSGSDRTGIITGNLDASVYALLCNAGAAQFGYTGINAITNGAWYHLVMVFDGTLTGNSNRLKLYINAVSQTLTYGDTIGTTTSNANAATVDLGSYANTFFLNGVQDESRVYATALSADWVTTEYNNQNSPATFYTVSSPI